MKAKIPLVMDPLQVDATRYALMRRLGFVFRHHMVGSLQPLNIMCRVMHLRLKADPLDLVALNGSVDQANALVRTAINACLDVVSWLSVDANSTVGLRDGVSECLSHLRSSFALRGFAIQFEEPDIDVKVHESALREVLIATVIASGDHAQGRSEILVSVQQVSNAIDITIQTCNGTQESAAESNAYRLLEWDEVERLALSHQVGFRRISPEMVVIHMPCGTL